jgi:hypothetical protein
MFLLDTLRGLCCTFGGTSGEISLYWSLRRRLHFVRRELRNIPVDLYTMSRIVTSAYVCKMWYAHYYFAAQFSTWAPVSTTLTTMKTTWGFSFHPHQVYFVQQPLIQLSLLWWSPNNYCFRFRFGQFLAKIQYEMRSWMTYQSQMKTRNSSVLWLCSASVGAFRSMAYYQTIFEGNWFQRPSF